MSTTEINALFLSFC